MPYCDARMVPRLQFNQIIHSEDPMTSAPKSRMPYFAVPAAGVLLAIGLAGCMKSQDPAALVAEAKQYQQKGDPKAAIIQLKNALQKSPDDAEARFLLGTIYASSGDPLSSEKELRRAASLGIKQERMAPVLGQTLLALGQFQNVLDETMPVAGTVDATDLQTLRGEAYLGLGKTEQAKEAFQLALGSKPDDPRALIGLAKYSLVSKDLSGAARFIDLAVAKNPTNGDVWKLKADLARSSGDADGARKAYDEAVKLKPADTATLIARANLLIALKKYAEAKTDVDAAQKLSPGTPLVFYTQALLDFSEGKNVAALESIQHVQQMAPDHLPTILLAGAIETGLGNNEQAEQHLRKYLQAEPSNVYARKLLASALLKNGQAKDALTILAPAINDSQKDPQLWMIAGESLMQSKDFGKANEYFEKANTLAPNVPLVYTAMAMSQMGQGDNTKAISQLELAASLDDKSTKPGIALVMAHLRLKQYDKAMLAVQSLEKKYPSDPQIFNLKGGVYLGMNDLVNARASFDKALAITPAYFPAIENLARLDLQDKKPDQAKKRFESVLVTEPKNVAAMTALAGIAQGVGQSGEAASWLEKAAAINPADVGPALQLGKYYVQSGAKEKASAIAQKLFAANDKNVDVIDFLGQVQANNNDFPGALLTFGKLAALRPTSALAQMRIASVQIAMKNNMDAIASLTKAVSLEPDNLNAQISLASVQAKNGDFDSAINIARQIQKQRAKEPIGFVLEGDLLMAQKKAPAAQKAYEQGATIKKTGPLLIKLHQSMMLAKNAKGADERLAQWLKDNPTDMAARIYLGDSYLAQRQLKPAIDQYETALRSLPQNVNVLNNLAYAYQLDKNPRALETAENAYKVEPNNPRVMDTLGWVLVEKENNVRGLGLLQKARALVPENEEIRFHLAVGLSKSGDKEGARKELDTLVTSKTFQGVEEAKRILKAL